MRCLFASLTAAALLAGYAASQTIVQSEPQSTVQTVQGEMTPEQIIQKFAEKESEFYEAWMQYTYTQTASIRILSVDGVPQDEAMTIVTEVVFNDDGTREVRLLRRNGQLRSVRYTDEDQEAINNINPFALTSKDLSYYSLKYLGKEKVDELECYAFSVKPKSTRKGRLYFEGKIWVDDRDLQVVRTIGRPVPQSRDIQFPEFETVRQRIDNKYWFPVWTHADSKLDFPDQVVRIEETITYGNYRRFSSKATIRYGSPNPPESK